MMKLPGTKSNDFLAVGLMAIILFGFGCKTRSKDNIKSYYADLSTSPGRPEVRRVTSVVLEEKLFQGRRVGIFIFEGDFIINDSATSVLVSSKENLKFAGSFLATDEDSYLIFENIKSKLGDNIRFIRTNDKPVELYYNEALEKIAYISYAPAK